MSPLLLKWIYNHTGINKTIYGGDIVDNEGSDYDTMEYLWEWRNMIKDLPNHHSVPGNHDDGNATNNLFSKQYVYGYLLSAEESNDIVRADNGLYYYIDNKSEKTRYLYLDTGYEGLSTISDDQLSFINESLISTPSGWHIVVIAHIWFMPDYDQYDVRPIPITGLSSSAEQVTTILDNYNSRSGDFVNCTATVEFCIGGHVHIDYVGTTSGGIPIILCETDSYNIRSDLTCSGGSNTESSISGIIADYDANKISVIRIGRGNSFSIDMDTGTKTDIEDDLSTEEGPTYTNILETVGYIENVRLSGSTGELRDNEGTYVTGFIPAPSGSTIYLKNIVMPDEQTSNNMVGFYLADQSVKTVYNFASTVTDNCIYDDNGNLIQFTFMHDNVEYIRICAQYIGEDSIISVNTPIN